MAELPGIVIEVFNDLDTSITYYGVIAGDVFRTQTGNVNEANGFARVRMHKADFEELIRQRSHRLRINAISGDVPVRVGC